MYLKLAILFLLADMSIRTDDLGSFHESLFKTGPLMHYDPLARKEKGSELPRQMRWKRPQPGR